MCIHVRMHLHKICVCYRKLIDVIVIHGMCNYVFCNVPYVNIASLHTEFQC